MGPGNAIEPEYTLFGTASAMNVADVDGTAHGKWGLSAQNVAHATSERLQDEMRKYAGSIRGVVFQLESLERHPYLASSDHRWHHS